MIAKIDVDAAENKLRKGCETCVVDRTPLLTGPPDGQALRGLGHHHDALAPLALRLVERYDAVKFGIFQRKSANFRGLVLFCIEADFCNQILIF